MSKEFYMKGKEVGLGSSDGKFDTVYISIQDWNKIQKKLKALEIIKEKKVDVNDLLNFVNRKSYNEFVSACDDNKKRVLTKQEYGLLKEVLRCCYEEHYKSMPRIG